MQNLSYSQFVLGQLHRHHGQPISSHSMSDARERIRNHIMGNKGNNSVVAALVNRIETQLSKTGAQNTLRSPAKPSVRPFWSGREDPSRSTQHSNPVDSEAVPAPEVALFFASHDTWGILDTGATKTVMGSNHVVSYSSEHPKANSEMSVPGCV